MTFHVVEPFGSVTVPSSRPSIRLNSEKLSTLLKSNISCHFNKNLDQELIDTLTKQIVESIDFFLNNPVD
jgi:hypothetical protein